MQARVADLTEAEIAHGLAVLCDLPVGGETARELAALALPFLHASVEQIDSRSMEVADEFAESIGL